MARINKEEEARRSGLAYALKIVMDAKNAGASDAEAIERLRDELKFRNITRAPLTAPKSEVERFCDEVRNNCVVTFKLMTMLVLHDEFGFGEQRLLRFMERFMLKAECLITPDCETSWADYQQILEDECRIRIDLSEEFLKLGRKEK